MLHSRVVVSAAWLCLLLVSSPANGDEEHFKVANKPITLADICANRQVPIISVEEANRLIDELSNDLSACVMSFQQSFFELKPVLLVNKETPLCSERKFNQIKQYHFRYVNPPQETYKLGDDLSNPAKKVVARPLHEEKFDYTVQLDEYKHEVLIPIALQQFFKAWALQVSGMCKRTFVDNIEKAMQQLTDTDYDMLEGEYFQISNAAHQKDTQTQAGNERKLPASLASIHPVSSQSRNPFQYDLTFNKLVYMPELEGELEEGDIRREDQVRILNLRSQPEMNKFMHACKHRFEPIFSKLIMPVVRLSKLGYDYIGSEIDDVREKLYNNALTEKWMLVTMVCMSQGRNVELSEPEDDPTVMEQLDYEPMHLSRIHGALWIKGAEALRKELDKIKGESSTGLKKLLFNAGIFGRKVVATIDPHQSAWYRRNQNTLANVLNVVSVMSNAISMISG